MLKGQPILGPLKRRGARLHLAAAGLLGAVALAVAGVGSATEGAPLPSDPVADLPAAAPPAALAPALARPDTATMADASNPAPWAIPALQLSRVQWRPPPPDPDAPPSEPLVLLATSDAPPLEAEGPRPGATPFQEGPFAPPVALTTREVEAILAPLPNLHGGPSASPDPTSAPAPGGGARTPRPERSTRPVSTESATVLGVFPSGDAEVVPDVTVVFSHPVVPLGAVGRATAPPFRWEPEVAGDWHWLDATTARFLPAGGRLPGGQVYRLVVEPGPAHAATDTAPGAAPGAIRHAHDVRIRIRGPLALAGSGQDQILPTAPVLVLGFDQAVDPQRVAAHASFRILDGPPDPETGIWRPDSQRTDTLKTETRATDPRVPAVVRAMEDASESEREALVSGRYPGVAALSPASPLPPGTWVRLELDAGLTSLEGPVETGRPQELTFRTADVFRFEQAPCPTPAQACTPRGFETLVFSNPVDPSQPLESRIQVTPEVPGLQFRTESNGALRLYGPFRPWTSYQVRVDRALVDVFGSALGEDLQLTLHFGRASALLSIRGGAFVSLDPSGRQELEVPVRGVDRVEVRILRADLARWDEWQSRGPAYRHSLEARAEGLQELERFELTPDDGGQGFSILQLPLAGALEEARGQVVVLLSGFAVDRASAGSGPGASPDPGTAESTGESAETPLRTAGAWVQLPSTRLQLLSDAEQLAVMVRTLDGSPAQGVRLSLPQAGAEASTDARGFASLSLAGSLSTSHRATVLMAERGGRVTLMPSAIARWGFPVWEGEAGAPGPVWAATLDRPLYRPGEPLALQGWVQEVVSGEARELREPERIRGLRVEVSVPTRGGGRRTALTQELEVSASGGFHTLVDLPAEMEPGFGQVQVTALGPVEGPAWTRTLGFRVADFRRPDYEVSVALPPEVLFQDEPFHAEAEARYFGGRGLPGSEVRWSLAAHRGFYAPPTWLNRMAPPEAGPGATAGAALTGPAWRFGPGTRSPLSPPSTGRFVPVVHEARTGPQGRHRLEVTPLALRDPFPHTLVAGVTVQDLNRQAGSASASAVLLPGRAIPGIRVLSLATPTLDPLGRLAPPGPFGTLAPLVEGDSVEVEVVVLDAEGALVPADRHGRPKVRVERLALSPDSERFVARWEVAQSSPVVCRPAHVPTPEGSPHGPAVEGYRCRASLPEAGEWLASVELVDHQGRRSRAEANLSVSAPGAGMGGFGVAGGITGFGIAGAADEGLEVALEGQHESGRGVLPDIMPGDTVTLRIRAPFSGGRGMAALDHAGIRRLVAVAMDEGETEQRIRFPVEGAPGPRTVEVLLESPSGERGGSGMAGFQVALDARRLTLTVEAPEERVQPGSTVPVSVQVTGDGGAPVPGAEVTIWLVDEAAFFAAGSRAQEFTRARLDPWNALYQTGGGIRTRGGLWLHTLREQGPPGEGELHLRILDAFTGEVPSGTLEILGSDGVVRSLRPDANGEFRVSELPPGDLRVRFFRTANDPDLDQRVTRDGNEGVALGTILLRPRVPPPSSAAEMALMLRASSPSDLPAPRDDSLAMDELRVSASAFDEYEAIEVPPPPETVTGTGVDPSYLRQDFTPLAGLAPRVVTDEDGVARTTFRLPDTLTRYRILAVARSGGADGVQGPAVGPAVGAGEGLVVAGQDLVVRATPPRFLRTGDQGEVSLLVENGGEVDREVEVALRAAGLTVEGTGGVRLHVRAGERREVRFPAQATVPGMGVIQARAVSGEVSDAVGVPVPVEIPAAPEHMAFRTLLEAGGTRTLMLAPETAVRSDWGGLEVTASPSLMGGLGSELLTLSETTLPWAGLRIARVRGLAALTRAVERDPTLGATLDSTALATLRQSVDEDMAALGQALRRVRPASPPGPTPGRTEPSASVPQGLAEAAQALGTWSMFEVLEASLALEEAHRAGMISGIPQLGSPAPPLPIEPSLLRGMLHGMGRGEPELAILWTLHRGGEGLASVPLPVQVAVTGLDTEGMRPLWLARVAAMVALAEEENGSGHLAPGSHHRFLEALENRARITPGGVTFRRGTPVPVEGALHFSASSPAEDAEILLALVQAAPEHPLLPGLVASVAGPEFLSDAEGAVGGSADGGGADGAASTSPWGPGVTGRALAALEAWAGVHAATPVHAEVVLAMNGNAFPGGAGLELESLQVRSGDSVQRRTLAMARLLQAGADTGTGTGTGTEGARLSLPLSLESRSLPSGADAPEGGAVSTRVLLSWSARDPFQPAVARGFVVRRSFESVDDEDDVRLDSDGIWRIRAGARVRVVHELLLPERRENVRLEDPFPAGFEPVQGTSGDEGAGRALTVAGAEILADGRWGLAGGTSHLLELQGVRWYREMLFGRDQVTAWTTALPPGTYRGSWIARATLPGDYIVPGVRAHEADRPDVRGRSEAHRVVIEAR